MSLTERLLHGVLDPAHLGVYAVDLRPDLADNPVDGLPALGRVATGGAHYQVLKIVAEGKALKKEVYSILQKKMGSSFYFHNYPDGDSGLLPEQRLVRVVRMRRVGHRLLHGDHVGQADGVDLFFNFFYLIFFSIKKNSNLMFLVLSVMTRLPGLTEETS